MPILFKEGLAPEGPQASLDVAANALAVDRAVDLNIERSLPKSVVTSPKHVETFCALQIPSAQSDALEEQPVSADAAVAAFVVDGAVDTGIKRALQRFLEISPQGSNAVQIT